MYIPRKAANDEPGGVLLMIETQRTWLAPGWLLAYPGPRSDVVGHLGSETVHGRSLRTPPPLPSASQIKKAFLF